VRFEYTLLTRRADMLLEPLYSHSILRLVHAIHLLIDVRRSIGTVWVLLMKGLVRPVLLSRDGRRPEGCATVWLRWCIRYSAVMVQAITVVMVPITTGRPDGVDRLNAWHTARRSSRYACGYCTAALSDPHSPQIWASNPMYQGEPSTGLRIEDAAQIWILSQR
jgi:hypothetical protein